MQKNNNKERGRDKLRERLVCFYKKGSGRPPVRLFIKMCLLPEEEVYEVSVQFKVSRTVRGHGANSRKLFYSKRIVTG